MNNIPRSFHSQFDYPDDELEILSSYLPDFYYEILDLNKREIDSLIMSLTVKVISYMPVRIDYDWVRYYLNRSIKPGINGCRTKSAAQTVYIKKYMETGIWRGITRVDYSFPGSLL